MALYRTQQALVYEVHLTVIFERRETYEQNRQPLHITRKKVL